MSIRTNERTVKCNHTNKHPMISPDIFNSINHAFLQSSGFGDCVVGDSHIDYILVKIINRYGCVGCVPLDRELGRSLLLRRAMAG